jgi:hypothetical protein
MDDATARGATTFGTLVGDVERAGASISRLEASVDRQGTVTQLGVYLDREGTEHHDEIRLSIFTPGGVEYDRILHLPSTLRWFDLVDLCTRAGAPLPGQLGEPGTIVRVAPYDRGRPAQSRELLALQVMLDAQPGEGRYLVGRWAAEWPTSFWTAGVITGVDHALRACWAVATTAIFDHGVLWRVYPVGKPDAPLFESWLGGGKAEIVWETADYVGIDLTRDLDEVPWNLMGEALLELEAIPQDDPGAPPKTMRVPITAR